MNKAELIAQQLAAGLNISNIWGTLIYNVKAYGAKGDGVTDDTQSIQACINAATQAGATIYSPPGIYLVSGLIIPGGTQFYGAGGSHTQILGKDTTTAIITITGDSSRTFIHDLWINRTTQGTSSNAHGIVVQSAGEFFTFERLWINNHYHGFYLQSGAAGGWIRNCYATNNKMDGFLIADPNLTLSECHSNSNGGNGYRIIPLNGNSGLFMLKCEAFTNTLSGIYIQGVAGKPISDTIINNCVLSYNKLHGINSDSYSSSFQIVNNFIEYSGINFAGNTTANVGACGIQFSANNTNVKLANNNVVTNAQHGISMNCPFESSNDSCYSNGFNAPGTGHGMKVGTGVSDFSITGGRFAALTGSANSQGFGIVLNGTNTRFLITGADCKGSVGNITGPIYVGTGSVGSIENTRGFNPLGLLTAPSIPVTGGTVTNTFNVPVRIFITGGTSVTISLYSTPIGISSGSLILYPNEILQLNYATAPTWTWFGL